MRKANGLHKPSRSGLCGVDAQKNLKVQFKHMHVVLMLLRSSLSKLTIHINLLIISFIPQIPLCVAMWPKKLVAQLQLKIKFKSRRAKKREPKTRICRVHICKEKPHDMTMHTYNLLKEYFSFLSVTVQFFSYYTMLNHLITIIAMLMLLLVDTVHNTTISSFFYC